MKKWTRDLDRILRGDATRLESLQAGTLDITARGMTVVIILLGMFSGLCMGSFAVLSGKAGTWMQMISSMGKVPALFLLTLVVTFPSLYVFNALLGSRLTLLTLLRLLIAAMSVMLALLASFGTIIAFFSFTSDSYPFMVMLNVVVFAFSGFLGLSFLLQTLHRLGLVQYGPLPAEPMDVDATGLGVPPAAPPELPSTPPGALDKTEDRAVSRNVRLFFQIWILVFGLVGAQMSWVLRPFIGRGNEFVLFRPRGSNFFEAVFKILTSLLGAR